MTNIFDKLKQYIRCICILQCCIRVQDDMDQRYVINSEGPSTTVSQKSTETVIDEVEALLEKTYK